MPRTLGDHYGTAAAAGFVALVVLAAAVLHVGHDRDVARAEADLAAAETAGRIAVDLSQSMSIVERSLREVSRGPISRVTKSVDALDGSGGTVVGLVRSDDVERIAAGALSPEILGTPALQVAIDQARDRARAVLSAPVAESVHPLVVLPLYEADGALWTVATRPTTAARRAEIHSFVVAELTVSDLVDEAFTTPTGSAAGSWEITDGNTVMAAQGHPVGRRAEIALPVGDRSWKVTTWRPAGTGLRSETWVTLGALGVLAMAAVAYLIRRRRTELAARRELEAVVARSEVVGGLAPVLQSSLQLADVLPALAYQLTDRFRLSGVSVAVSDDAGALVEVFANGERTDPTVLARAVFQEHLDSGQTAALALTRGGRTVAELRIRAGDDLSRADLDGIGAAAELVTSAIATARAIEGQQAAMDELRELDGLRSVFLSTAAHELRTPVAAIQGFATVLDERWDELEEDDRRAAARRLARNADALADLSRDLLDFSRLDVGDVSLDTEVLDLGEFAAASVERLGTAWHSHRFVVSVDGAAPVQGDEVALERVLTNLVSNAVKYSPEGSTVTVSVRNAGGDTELIVDDAGSGIAESEREQIFERFFRGSGPEVVRTRGVGLGLAVVRELVRRHDGEVAVDASPSGGARFIVRLPAAVPPVATDPVAPTPAAEGGL